MKRTNDGPGRWLFAANFLKHPSMLGSVIPSSRYLVERLLAPVDWSRARCIVEYGPGVGTITREILARMHADARLLAFELNREFAAYLRRGLDDPRLTVVEGSATGLGREMEALQWESLDYAVSGIPFSTMPPTVRDTILSGTQDRLGAGGEFLVYQFSDRVRPHLERRFEVIDRGVVFRNFLPARCYRCHASGRNGHEVVSNVAM